MLKELVADGVKTIIVESPDRFARDLAVQLAGHDYLRGLGLELVPSSAPDFFVEDTSTAILVRQVLGAISQFEKATLVAKLKAARDGKRQATGKCEGRPSYSETQAALVAEVRDLRRRGQTLQSIADVLAERGPSQPQRPSLCPDSDCPHGQLVMLSIKAKGYGVGGCLAGRGTLREIP